MQDINYKNLKVGQEITVVTAWTEDTTFEDIADKHFFETRIEEVYFEPKGELALLRIWAKDGDGQLCRVNYVSEDGQIKSASVVVALADLKAAREAERAGMICLAERKPEFVAALNRTEKSDLEVFAGFERDSFVVVNRAKRKEYRVHLQSQNGKPYASCECGDFIYRERICKHISEVLVTFLGAFTSRKATEVAE